MARHVYFIVRGKFLEHFDLAYQPRSRVKSFEQIVAQHPVRRNFTVERLLERVDVIDAFADVRTFLEQILVHVRHRKRVRINSRRAGKIHWNKELISGVGSVGVMRG